MSILKNCVVRVVVISVIAPGILASIYQQNSLTQSVQQEEGLDYFQKWLKEDVVYIITPDEKAVFESLTTIEEKEQFIEQFWFRRDPDPGTSINEFQEEHYRRIAYANERFGSGRPGWRTDRGRIYIIHGPPTEIDSRPLGGVYDRPVEEGGGRTATYAFEVWRYQFIEGIGPGIEIEFVDPTMSGEFRLARDAEEKDALLLTPYGGLTMAEELDLAAKTDRPYFVPSLRDQYPLMVRRERDNPFQRYERLLAVQRPPQIRYPDLREVIRVNISFDNPLHFLTRHDYFRLNDQTVLVPITLEIENQELTFGLEGGGGQAQIAIYGVVSGINNRIVTEFEEELSIDRVEMVAGTGLTPKSIYQKIIAVESRMRYRLDLVVKDIHSGKVGVLRKAIAPPSYADGKLAASGLVLSDFIRLLREAPAANEMFVLGDVWIRPSLSATFPSTGRMGVYFQLYNALSDEATREPNLELRYAIERNGETVFEQRPQGTQVIQYASPERMVLINVIALNELVPGDYRMVVEVRDRISSQETRVSEVFHIVPDPQAAVR